MIEDQVVEEVPYSKIVIREIDHGVQICLYGGPTGRQWLIKTIHLQSGELSKVIECLQRIEKLMVLK